MKHTRKTTNPQTQWQTLAHTPQYVKIEKTVQTLAIKLTKLNLESIALTTVGYTIFSRPHGMFLKKTDHILGLRRILSKLKNTENIF